MLKVQEIREIIKLIDESSISEFNYETEGTNISLKKSVSSSTQNHQVQAPVEETVKSVTPAAPEQPAAKTKPEEKSEKKEEEPQTENTNQDYDYEIVSPMVGTFYAAPSPEDEAYVNAGSTVEPESVVCIVEAMKLFNEIEAEITGEIVEVIANDGELVEYGQPLFRVKKK